MMKIENIVYQYQQGNVGVPVILHRKMIPVLVVKLSKLKATLWVYLFKNFSSIGLVTMLANWNVNFSSPILETFMGIFAMKTAFKVCD